MNQVCIQYTDETTPGQEEMQIFFILGQGEVA